MAADSNRNGPQPAAIRESQAQPAPVFVLLALLQKLVGEFFLIWGREIWREIWREFWGIFSDPRNKGSKISGKISERFS